MFDRPNGTVSSNKERPRGLSSSLPVKLHGVLIALQSTASRQICLFGQPSKMCGNKKRSSHADCPTPAQALAGNIPSSGGIVLHFPSDPLSTRIGIYLLYDLCQLIGICGTTTAWIPLQNHMIELRHQKSEHSREVFVHRTRKDKSP